MHDKVTPDFQGKVIHTSSSSLSPRMRVWEIVRHPWIVAVIAVSLSIAAVHSISIQSSTFILQENSILNLPLLAHIQNLPKILSSDFLLFTNGQYRPVSYAALAIVRTYISADNVVFWHGWLLCFHGVNALLVFGLVHFFTPKWIPALLAALFFAVHPLSAVTINNINNFYFLLALTLSLITINTYLRFLRNGNRFYYVLSLTTFFLALGTARQAFVLGLILFACEWVYRQNGIKRILIHLSPFILIPLAVIPILRELTPHPLHFKYIEIHENSFWHGFFSFVGATGTYLDGLFLTRKLTTVLHELVEQIYTPVHIKFIGWGFVNLAILGITFWHLVRKRWTALGLTVAIFSLIPYASVAYNRVLEYVAWNYLYFPLAGLAVFMGGILDRILQMNRRVFRHAFQWLLVGLICFWGMRGFQINQLSKNPLDYWLKTLDDNLQSQTALYEIGNAYLTQRQPKHALYFFFAPMVKNIKNPCLSMARYYTQTGDYLAAAIHLRFGSSRETSGIVLEPHSKVAAEMFLSAGVLDHAEEHLGKLLMVNPNDTDAMIQLSQTWFYKGFVKEAYRMLSQVRSIDPYNESARSMENHFRQMEHMQAERKDTPKIDLPSLDWLEFILNQERSPLLCRNIEILSDRLPDDPVIQLEATIALLQQENYTKAAQKAVAVMRCLEGYAYACGVATRAFSLAGEIDRAIQTGLKAISLDSQSTLAWDSLAMAYSKLDPTDDRHKQFAEIIGHRPHIASIYYYNLALQKKAAGLDEEAASLYEKAIAAKPDYFEALLELGRTYTALHRPEDAIKALQSALAIKSDNPDVYQYLGRALIMSKKMPEGIQAIRSAIQIDPENPTHHYLLGLALDTQQKSEEAAREYRRVLELNPKDAIAHFKLANCAFRNENLEEAEVHYRLAAQIDPALEYVHLNLSSVLSRKGKIDEAILAVEEEIQHNPRLSESYDRLIYFYCQKSDFSRARESADRAKQLGLPLSEESKSFLQKIQHDENSQ